MPTRSGLDFHELNPWWFKCSYCYKLIPNCPVTCYSGMVLKRVQIRVDDGVDDFVTLPGEYTEVWTEPHCWCCNRKIRGDRRPRTIDWLTPALAWSRGQTV